MKPLYTYTRDLQPIWGGDSLPDLSFYAEGEQSGPIIPVGVCAQILNRFGTQVHEWEASIEHDGLVLLDRLYDTSMLRVGNTNTQLHTFFQMGEERLILMELLLFYKGLHYARRNIKDHYDC